MRTARRIVFIVFLLATSIGADLAATSATGNVTSTTAAAAAAARQPITLPRTLGSNSSSDSNASRTSYQSPTSAVAAPLRPTSVDGPTAVAAAPIVTARDAGDAAADTRFTADSAADAVEAVVYSTNATAPTAADPSVLTLLNASAAAHNSPQVATNMTAVTAAAAATAAAGISAKTNPGTVGGATAVVGSAQAAQTAVNIALNLSDAPAAIRNTPTNATTSATAADANATTSPTARSNATAVDTRNTTATENPTDVAAASAAHNTLQFAATTATATAAAMDVTVNTTSTAVAPGTAVKVGVDSTTGTALTADDHLSAAAATATAAVHDEPTTGNIPVTPASDTSYALNSSSTAVRDSTANLSAAVITPQNANVTSNAAVPVGTAVAGGKATQVAAAALWDVGADNNVTTAAAAPVAAAVSSNALAAAAAAVITNRNATAVPELPAATTAAEPAFAGSNAKTAAALAVTAGLPAASDNTPALAGDAGTLPKSSAVGAAALHNFSSPAFQSTSNTYLTSEHNKSSSSSGNRNLSAPIANRPIAAIKAAAAKQGSSTSSGVKAAKDKVNKPIRSMAVPVQQAASIAGNESTPTVDPAANWGPAVGCVPPTTPEPEPQGIAIQQLPPDLKPNFIIILTDDQGWDDIGLHHPQKPGSKAAFVKTPNLDKFLMGSKQFDNFYVAPMCSQSRAALLTGRDYPLTGTMLVNGGYDYINRAEHTSAHIMADGGYKTAHFGKWHNGRTLGYEPWFMGFQESWFPDLYINLDNLMRHNGKYVQTYGLMEQDLMDKMLRYLDQQAANNSQPFYLYYAPNAIHQGFMRPGQGPKWQRPAPEPYLAKYRYLLQQNISQSTIEVWAFLEYMDDVLGRLFEYIDHSPLKDNTYVMVLSDNGSELFQGEMPRKEVRMPSGMQGYKRAVEEGGIRNYLAVKGPGVQAGVVDSTLLDITDILPTMADLAGVEAPPADKQAFTGVSFKNLLLTGPQRPATARLAQRLATPQQRDRFLFSLSPICWDPDSVPVLNKNREVLKPQTLMEYDVGGYANNLYNYFYNDTKHGNETGFQRCIGVRYQDYKWLGRTNKVYRLVNNSHIELPCNEVTGAEGAAVAALMSGAARTWWNSLIAGAHSFQKPTFYLGFEGWNVTNLLPDGAHERTAGNVRLLPNGASGFVKPGDRMCFALEVVAGGHFEVVALYASTVAATFRMSVGQFVDIQAGTAPSITTQLPASTIMAGQSMGFVQLESTNGQKIDACLVLVENSVPGTRVFVNLGNVRFIKTDAQQLPPAVVADVVVYNATNSSSSVEDVYVVKNDTHAKASKPGKQQQQQQPGNHQGRQRNQHTGQQQGDTVSAASRTNRTTTLSPSHLVANSTSSPDKHVTSYNKLWVTKAMRQVVPAWVIMNDPSKTPDIEEHPALANEALPFRYAAAGGRKAGPKQGTVTSSDSVSGTKHKAAATVAPSRRTAVHLGGKPGVTRHHSHRRRQIPPMAAQSRISDHVGEDEQLVTKVVTNLKTPGPKNRFRLDYHEGKLQDEVHPASMDVIGAMPDSESVSRQNGTRMDSINHLGNAKHQPGLVDGTLEIPLGTLSGSRNGGIMGWGNNNAASPASPGDVGGSGWEPLASAAEEDNDKGEHAPPRIYHRARPVGNSADSRSSDSGWMLPASATDDDRHDDKAGHPTASVYHTASSVGRQGTQNSTQKGANARSSNLKVDRHTFAVFTGVHDQPAATMIDRMYLKPTPAMRETEMQALKAYSVRKGKEQMVVTAGSGSTQDIGAAWQALRHKNSWPDGQGVFESMFSPYHAEMIDACQACQPRV